MYRVRTARSWISTLVILAASLLAPAVGAQEDLVVRVSALDPMGIAVAGIRFTYQGVETDTTTDAGMTEVRVPSGGGPRMSPGSAIELSLPGSLGATWFLIDDTVHVPGPGAPPAEVVVMKRADLRRLAGDVSDARGGRVGEDLSPEERRRVLLDEAKKYGLGEGEIEKALRAFGESAEGPLEKGIAQYLAGEYEAAATSLQRAVEEAEERRETGERIVAAADDDVAQSARYLGQTFYEQGRYGGAAEAFRKAVSVRPDDTTLLSWLVNALLESAEWEEAETVARRVLSIDEASYGPEHPEVARDANNLVNSTPNFPPTSKLKIPPLLGCSSSR